MRYLIFYDNYTYRTTYFELSSMYAPGMIVFDLEKNIFYDGKIWRNIEEDVH